MQPSQPLDNNVMLLQGTDTVSAEKIMRQLLPGLPPLRFQHLMRVVCHEILHHIQDDHPTRQASTDICSHKHDLEKYAGICQLEFSQTVLKVASAFFLCGGLCGGLTL